MSPIWPWTMQQQKERSSTTARLGNTDYFPLIFGFIFFYVFGRKRKWASKHPTWKFDQGEIVMPKTTGSVCSKSDPKKLQKRVNQWRAHGQPMLADEWAEQRLAQVLRSLLTCRCIANQHLNLKVCVCVFFCWFYFLFHKACGAKILHSATSVLKFPRKDLSLIACYTMKCVCTDLQEDASYSTEQLYSLMGLILDDGLVGLHSQNIVL